eukprot:TRINITY_DN6563_c0_g1_i2.p1 TRINITY_DN6563_c0_g1~~TRINITY_DN6563_c0_g1_i2.p1  ORF type:complete len:540 (-),score=120.57 TRINITY_DN6563_c0_g1_i2:828-2447(-)
MTLLSTLRGQPLLIPTAAATLALLLSIQRLSSSVRAGASAKLSDNAGLRSIEEALSLSRVQKAADGKHEKVAVNGEFLRRLRKILGIMIPSFFCRETAYMGLVAVMMVLRTLCDLWVIQNGTDIENAIISRKKSEFFRFLGRFFLSMIPIALVNNLLKHGLHQMAICFRQRLTLHLFEKYLKDLTFYKVSNLDTRIKNPDQLLDQDVSKFCTSVSDLYSNLSKPILDIVIYARRLSDAVGPVGPASMLGYLFASGVFLTSLRKPLGLFTATEQALEGDFRAVNSRLITHSEEIAFYGGNQREDQGIQFSFKRLISHLTRMVQFRASVGVIDTIVAKYFATVVAYLVISPPFLNLSHPRHLNSTPNELMLDYYRSGRMLVGMAQAVGRLVLSGRELNRLAGFTARVNTLITVLDDLNAGKYERSVVKKDGSQPDDLVLIPDSGDIIEKDHVISFEGVPIVTPNRDVLTKSLTFEIRSGMNLLVVGPNGCGKSSLFRILGGLWPIFGGKLIKPAKRHLFYVPQVRIQHLHATVILKTNIEQ